MHGNVDDLFRKLWETSRFKNKDTIIQSWLWMITGKLYWIRNTNVASSFWPTQTNTELLQPAVAKTVKKFQCIPVYGIFSHFCVEIQHPQVTRSSARIDNNHYMKIKRCWGQLYQSYRGQNGVPNTFKLWKSWQGLTRTPWVIRSHIIPLNASKPFPKQFSVLPAPPRETDLTSA